MAGLFLLAALAGACAARSGETAEAASGAPAVSVQRVAPAGHGAVGGGTDWRHVLQVVANVRADPPAEPLVILLGGSAARESTVGDDAWAAQIAAAGGPPVAAFNLGSRNRTLAQDLALVRLLPRRPAIVYIGVNVGRFTPAPSTPVVELPEPTDTLPPYDQHQYSRTRILSAAKKKALVRSWLSERYPHFKANYAANLRALDSLVRACRARGLRPVLLELPRDTAIIGRSLDAPIARYTADCRKLARTRDVPWVSFVAAARLKDRDFYDLWHLVEPGREVWQGLLSGKSVELLKRYGMDGADL